MAICNTVHGIEPRVLASTDQGNAFHYRQRRPSRSKVNLQLCDPSAADLFCAAARIFDEIFAASNSSFIPLA